MLQAEHSSGLFKFVRKASQAVTSREPTDGTAPSSSTHQHHQLSTGHNHTQSMPSTYTDKMRLGVAISQFFRDLLFELLIVAIESVLQTRHFIDRSSAFFSHKVETTAPQLYSFFSFPSSTTAAQRPTKVHPIIFVSLFSCLYISCLSCLVSAGASKIASLLHAFR